MGTYLKSRKIQTRSQVFFITRGIQQLQWPSEFGVGGVRILAFPFHLFTALWPKVKTSSDSKGAGSTRRSCISIDGTDWMEGKKSNHTKRARLLAEGNWYVTGRLSLPLHLLNMLLNHPLGEICSDNVLKKSVTKLKAKKMRFQYHF